MSAGDESERRSDARPAHPRRRGCSAAVADLSELAHVRSRTQDARDITAEFTSPRRRLADALAERRGLLRQLARADTPNETAAIRARLRAVNRRIDRAQAELRRLRERVAFAAVTRRGRARRRRRRERWRMVARRRRARRAVRAGRRGRRDDRRACGRRAGGIVALLAVARLPGGRPSPPGTGARRAAGGAARARRLRGALPR